VPKAKPTRASKKALKAELLALLEGQLAALTRAHLATREGATHEEAKPEDDKDTRALEQSYLARGQAARIEELRDSVATVAALPLRAFGPQDAIGVGALATLEDEEGTTQRLWLAPSGGGSRLAGGVQVTTPKSPLGQALIGRLAGEDVEAPAGGQRRVLTIVRVE
jgi:transcription elongation GreA/GreB family factor